MKLAILGANYLQLPAYLKAREMGIETIGFAWKEGSVSKAYCDKFHPISIVRKDAILNICAKEKIDGILTIASDISVPTVAYIAEKLNLVSNTIESANLSNNKFLMRNAFRRSALRCPSYYKVNHMREINFNNADIKFPLIVKPVDRSGSRGVCKVDNSVELREAIKIALKESLMNQAIVEEFIQGTEVSIETISYKGTHYILCITDKVTSGPPFFVELEHHQPSSLKDEILERIKKLTISALNSLDIKFGASHTELLLTDNEIFITEVGARMAGDFIGSDLVYLSTGYDFLKGVIEVATNNFIKPQKSWSKYSGIYFFSEKTPQIGEIIKNLDYQEFIIKREIVQEKLGILRQSSDRSGYFIYQSDLPFKIHRYD